MAAGAGSDFDLGALRARIGDTFAARVSWILTALSEGGAGLDPGDARDALGAAYPTVPGFFRMIRFWRGRLGACAPSEIVEATDARVELVLRDERARRWRCVVRLEDESPRRIALYSLFRELPAGVRIREANPEDAAALEAIERGSPIVQADGARITIVRGRAYFDQARLMERCHAYIAEDEGRPVAFDAIAFHDGRLLGQRLRLGYRHHTRVSASHQRLGLNEALMAFRQERVFRDPVPQAAYTYVDPSNDVIRSWSPMPPWSVRPLRAQLRCDALRAPATGRTAVDGDLAHVAKCVNALHGGTEMFLPYDVARLRERLARHPSQYGMTHVRVDGGAVVGVWDAGERVIRERAGDANESLRAWVLDYGVATPAALPALERLLRGWCGELAERGVTHLSLFYHDASAAAPLVRALAESSVPVELQSPTPEPPDLAARGIYVDPIYW